MHYNNFACPFQCEKTLFREIIKLPRDIVRCGSSSGQVIVRRLVLENIVSSKNLSDVLLYLLFFIFCSLSPVLCPICISSTVALLQDASCPRPSTHIFLIRSSAATVFS